MGPEGCIHTHNETKLETALGLNNHCIHRAELYTEEGRSERGEAGNSHMFL